MRLPEAVEYVIVHIMQSGGQAYLVGGALRDRMLGRTASDYDIATSFPPEKIEEIFQKEKTYLAGKRFGTVTVAAGGLSMEITTFRKESGYSDNRHPDEVAFVSDLESDLSRRDFTINAMAYNPFVDTGLIDPFHGKDDLRKRIIRTVGVPRERFQEDPLRMLRGIRFAAQLDFELEEETRKAISECRAWLRRVSRERLREELVRLLLSPRPDKGLLLLQETGILPILLYVGNDAETATDREADRDRDKDKEMVTETDMDKETAAAILSGKEAQIIKNVPEDQDTRLAALLTLLWPSAREKQLKNMLWNLRLDKKAIAHTLDLIKGYSRFCSMNITPYSMRKLLGAMNIPDMKRILHWYNTVWNAYENKDMEKKHSEAIRLLHAIWKKKDPVFPSDLAVNGTDIQSAGIGTDNGRLVGEALHLAYEWVLKDPEKNDRDFLIKELKKKYGIPEKEK